MSRRLAIFGVALLSLVGCRKAEPTPAASPRIITFAPHITDIAFDMGLGDHVVGVSSRCIVPEGRHPTVMGDAFSVNSEVILSEQPDIVFYNQKDSQFDALRRQAPSVKLIRMRNGTLAELREGIVAMGRAVGREDLADAMLKRMDAQLDTVAAAVAGRPRPRVLFLSGYNPPSTMGTGWTTAELLEIAGGTNVAAEAGLDGWATINLETIYSLRPDVIICLVAGGGESVRRAEQFWARFDPLQAVRDGRVYVTDDRRLTIPGSRVGATAAKLARMIHPDAFDEASEENGRD